MCQKKKVREKTKHHFVINLMIECIKVKNLSDKISQNDER